MMVTRVGEAWQGFMKGVVYVRRVVTKEFARTALRVRDAETAVFGISLSIADAKMPLEMAFSNNFGCAVRHAR